MKKFRKYIGLIAICLAVMLIVTACAQSGGANKPPTGFIYGSIYKFIGKPMQNIMLYFSNIIGGLPNLFVLASGNLLSFLSIYFLI